MMIISSDTNACQSALSATSSEYQLRFDKPIMFRQFSTEIIPVIERFATDPGDSEGQRLNKIIGVTLVMFGVLTYVGYGLLYIAFNEWPAGLVALGGGVLFVSGLLTYGFFRLYAVHFFYWMSILAVSLTLIDLLLGGFVNAGAVIVWILALPLIPVVAYKPRYSFLGFLIAVIIFTGEAYLRPYVRSSNNLPSGLITVLYVINTLGIATFVLLSTYYYVWQNNVLNRLLQNEREKTEALLLNILPKEIAAILKNENRVVADQFDQASILFADIVNFTPLSAQMPPAELVELLNEVFSSLDTLVEKYELEKIKTIGDCYMVAAGVPRPRLDHAHVLTRLALEIRSLVDQRTFRGHKLSLRIGLNSGPVVAGIIGRKKFIYDLWGDAVNIASRMESQGMEGCIQVTEATHDLIKNDFQCEPRGVIRVKGRGDMKVWHVLDQTA